MALIDRVRERTGSDLSDTELQAMIDGIVAELDARLGPAGEQTIVLGDPGDPLTRQRRLLKVSPPIDSAQAVTVTESDPGHSSDAGADTVLDASDFRILHGGRTLLRLIDGPNGREFWAPLVTLTFTPIGEQAARDEAVIRIMQIDLTTRGGIKSERAGDYQVTLAEDAGKQREQIIEGLATRRGMVMA